LCFLVLTGFLPFKITAQDSKQSQKIPGINLEFMDNSVTPVDDFFKYVNGKWLDNTEIPDDKTRWGSFDDSGSRYDKNGNLNNWWTDADLKQFEVLGKSLAQQYSAIEVLPETFINGAFTLGENIGDLGGVNAAYDALQLSFQENGRPENIDDLSPEQRFFISWATVWRTKAREDALKNLIKTDPHSPGMNRAVQPLLNIDAFYEAFNIKESDKMYLDPNERVKIY